MLYWRAWMHSLLAALEGRQLLETAREVQVIGKRLQQ